MWVIVWLAYGCPIQAIVQAFGLEERTVSDWQAGAGQDCQQVHEPLVENSQQDLEPVQADDTCTCMQVQVNQSHTCPGGRCQGNTERHDLDGIRDLGSYSFVEGRGD